MDIDISKIEIDTTGMIPIGDINEATDEDAQSLKMLADRATRFLSSQKWCHRIVDGWLDRGWPGILAVFFFKLVPAEGSAADDRVWVIVGDLPPAYIDISECPNGASSIDGYIGAMQEWVRNVKDGTSIDDVVPVNAPPTPEYAEILESRLKFIETRILPEFDDELQSKAPTVGSGVSAEVARKPGAKPHFDVLPPSAVFSTICARFEVAGGDQGAELCIATTVKSKNRLD